MSPYPEDRDPWVNEQRACNVMISPVPTMLIHFVDDAFCNVVVYPTWFKRLAQGMVASPRGDYGFRVKTFYSAHLPGGHDRGQEVLNMLRFDDIENCCIRNFWHALMGIPP